MRLPILQQNDLPHLRAGSADSAPIKDAPISAHSKVDPQCSASDRNGCKGIRDRMGDDGCIIVRDRKPQNENWKSLPKPLPIPSVSNTLSQKAYDEEDEDEEAIQHLSPQDLLKRHVKHARKVRARLREARLQRIACYKTRLALLLPRPAEQFKSDTAA